MNPKYFGFMKVKFILEQYLYLTVITRLTFVLDGALIKLNFYQAPLIFETNPLNLSQFINNIIESHLDFVNLERKIDLSSQV